MNQPKDTPAVIPQPTIPKVAAPTMSRTAIIMFVLLGILTASGLAMMLIMLVRHIHSA